MAKRQNLQKMAAFNLGVAEGVHQKKKERDTDFHVSPCLDCISYSEKIWSCENPIC